jgi:hypothetical protein
MHKDGGQGQWKLEETRKKKQIVRET